MYSFNQNKKEFLLKDSLPHNFLAEKMILSCMVLNSETIDVIRQHLVIEAFYFKNHQQLYSSLLIMIDEGLQIDLVTMTVFLQDNGVLERIGGIKVILDLGNQTPTFSYLTDYIDIVKEKFFKRALIRFGYKAINLGYITNQSFENNLTLLEKDFFELTNSIRGKKFLTTGQIVNSVFLELKEKFLNPNLLGLSSGFKNLDQLTQGFQKSDLIILAGRPSMGKTAFSLNLALNCMKESELPILFCSLEMSKEQIIYRLLSSETGINQMKLRSGELRNNDWVKLNKIIRIIAKLPFFIDDTSDLLVQDIRSKIKIILQEQGQLGLVIIDYLQLMQNMNVNSSNRVQELSQITRSLKRLAREFNIPIIALSQLSRNVDNRLDQRPILSDLRESGSIEQDADLVLMLYKPNLKNLSSVSSQTESNDSSFIELIIAKHRNGPLGTIKLKFNKSYLQFEETI